MAGVPIHFRAHVIHPDINSVELQCLKYLWAYGTFALDMGTPVSSDYISL